MLSTVCRRRVVECGEQISGAVDSLTHLLLCTWVGPATSNQEDLAPYMATVTERASFPNQDARSLAADSEAGISRSSAESGFELKSGAVYGNNAGWREVARAG